MAAAAAVESVGLALEADSSARHLSCIETGKAQPSRAMVLKLCETLQVPLRERNTVLLAAGYAPEYRERRLDDAEMASARAALDAMLTAHEPYPAVVVDRYGNVIATNKPMRLFEDEAPRDRAPNMYRLALDPAGQSAPAQLINYRQVREWLLERLLRQVNATGDPILRELHDEVSAYPVPPMDEADDEPLPSPFAVPLRIRAPMGELRMFSTMVTFGAPADVTLSELAIELFYPLDDFTATALSRIGAPHRRS